MIRQQILFIVLLIHLCSHSFVHKRNEIYWEQKRLLTWKDYKGNAPIKSNNVAVTNIALRYEILSRNSIRITNVMNKKKSWVLKPYRTEKLLIHEQYHFNLAEKFARILRKELSEITEPSTGIVQEIYDKCNLQHNKEQHLYDKETEFSQNKSEQKRWQKKIDTDLAELEAYTDNIIYLNQ